MVSKREAVEKALHAALDSWNWKPPPSSEFGDFYQTGPTAVAAVQTERSSTVFSAEAEDWLRYLRLTDEQRYAPELEARVYLQPDIRVAAFQAANEDSTWFAKLLDDGLRLLRQRASTKPHVLAALDDLIFGNASNVGAEIHVLVSAELPSDGTRETHTGSNDVRLVLHSGLVGYVRGALTNAALSPEERLGVYWPLVSRVISQLAYPSSPLDRFAAKIEVFAKCLFVAVNILYEGRKSGHLVPTPTGAVYERMVCESSKLTRDQLLDQHPLFRTFGRLSFVLRAQSYSSYVEDVRVAAREHLDTVYLRLSLAGAMPEIAPAMQPLSYERKGKKVKTGSPVIGSNGVIDLDDLEAWKRVSGNFKDLGFTILRQLGIGEFGRVYEVLNTENPQYPARLALKVDRIAGKKKKAILEAEEALVVGRNLAHSPHLIRLYDTGKLRGERFTYHVLQLIDGDTLDNLIGVTGTEHASVSRPPRARSSQFEAELEYNRALSTRGSELWRRERMALPFRHALSSALLLDLITSVLLWMVEVHRIGYAINDLKNGNLMMSRRGQLKGIDLDSYAPVHSTKDKITDFMFLAVSLVLLIFSAPVIGRGRNLHWEELIESENSLRAGLEQCWPFGDVERISEGRVSHDELSAVLVDLVHRSRHLIYAKHPEVFVQDIARLTSLKHRLLMEEMVID